MEAKPPIKLRIFTTRGTSQIVSGTEESADESNDAASPMLDQEDEDEEMVSPHSRKTIKWLHLLW